MSPLEEHLLSLRETSLDCGSWVLREVIIPYNKLMQLVSQEISTGTSTMAIVNGKEGAARPILDLFEFWANDVQNNTDPVLIIISNDTLMRIGRVG